MDPFYRAAESGRGLLHTSPLLCAPAVRASSRGSPGASRASVVFYAQANVFWRIERAVRATAPFCKEWSSRRGAVCGFDRICDDGSLESQVPVSSNQQSRTFARGLSRLKLCTPPTEFGQHARFDAPLSGFLRAGIRCPPGIELWLRRRARRGMLFLISGG